MMKKIHYVLAILCSLTLLSCGRTASDISIRNISYERGILVAKCDRSHISEQGGKYIAENFAPETEWEYDGIEFSYPNSYHAVIPANQIADILEINLLYPDETAREKEALMIVEKNYGNIQIVYPRERIDCGEYTVQAYLVTDKADSTDYQLSTEEFLESYTLELSGDIQAAVFVGDSRSLVAIQYQGVLYHFVLESTDRADVETAVKKIVK